jgi:hypothetical protein
MKDADRTIESLLAGLRDAEPPPGMHHRILDAMPARRATAYQSRRLLPSAIALSLASALAIMFWVPHHRRIPTNPRRYTANVDAPPTKPRQMVAKITPREPRRSISRVSLRPARPTGFPAPPLPLTGQEKLLLRLAHRNDAQDMNLLNPQAQAQLSAKTTKQFQQFFGMDNDQMRSESE